MARREGITRFCDERREVEHNIGARIVIEKMENLRNDPAREDHRERALRKSKKSRAPAFPSKRKIKKSDYQKIREVFREEHRRVVH